MALAARPAARLSASPANRGRATRVVVRASASPKAAFAAAGAAAVLLASSQAALAQPDGLAPLAPRGADPVAVLATQNPGKGLLDKLQSLWPKVEGDDAFASGRKQERGVADTQRPIPIPTEQEAVAPEAFPNPSEAYSPRPPVLAAAEGDEHQGANAGQFSGLTGEGRQELIDKKSPAQASRS